MKIQFFLLFIIWVIKANAQVEISQNNLDFGDIVNGEMAYQDVIIKNLGNKKCYVLTIEKPHYINYLLSSDEMLPDSSITLRIFINDPKAKKFEDKVQLFFSSKNTPDYLTISGQYLLADNEKLNSCPTFNEIPKGNNALINQFSVIAIDATTSLPIKNAEISIVQQGNKIKQVNTDTQGQAITDLPIGITYFSLKKAGFITKDTVQYINFRRNTLEIALLPKEISKFEEKTLEHLTQEQKEEEPSKNVIKDNIAHQDINSFSEHKYKKVNTVFVIDISSSMKQYDRIELMKYGLISLIDMLRPIDQVGIVTYASNAQTLLKPTNVSDQKMIKAEISKLRAAGFTSGGAGIKLGFKEAQKSFIDGGVNQVVVITDGAFNKNDGNYEKVIKKYHKKGIILNVIGVKSDEKSSNKMTEVTKIGGGTFIPFNNLDEAEVNLKQAIKISALKD